MDNEIFGLLIEAILALIFTIILYFYYIKKDTNFLVNLISILIWYCSFVLIILITYDISNNNIEKNNKMNDKLLHISDISLSERDIIQEKDNSIQNKSFNSTDLDFPNLVEKKEYFQIKIIFDENMVELPSKSIKKIFSLISGIGHEALEDNYLEYITWLIGGGNEIEKQQLLTLNGKADNVETNLDPAYYQLLNKTKIYYINIPKMNKLNKINERIKLKNYSLEKIASFLGLDIYDISDFIEICILSFQEKENLENKKTIESLLIEKFNNCGENEINELNLTKKFNLVLKESEKCRKSQLENLENYFEKVWNEIEKKSKIEENDNNSRSKHSSDNEEEESKSEENYGIPNSCNINKNNNKKIDKNKNTDLGEENGCAENICENICNIY